MRSEQVTFGTVLKAIAAFAGVLLITLGAPKKETADEIASSGSVKEAPQWYDFVLMSLMPIIIAFGNLSMGQFRTLDPILIPVYSNVSILVIGVIVCLSNGKGFVPSAFDL